MTEDHRIRILYIAGWGRSGSTILADILGQLQGFVSAGELRFIWERGFLDNQFCGCGKPFLECPVWKGIVEVAFGGPQNVDAARFDRDMFRFTRTLRVLQWLGGRARLQVEGQEIRGYLEAVRRLYEAIAQQPGSRVIVDASKFPAYGAFLRLIPTIDLRMLHITRDPRAVAFSWSRAKVGAGAYVTETTPVIGPIWSSLRWAGWNRVIEYFGSLDPQKYLRMRYEDFTADPRAWILRILDLLDEPAQGLPFLDASTVRLAPSHTISGNPGRFNVGTVRLEEDIRWLKEMSFWPRLLVSLLCLPMLGRYGYSFWKT